MASMFARARTRVNSAYRGGGSGRHNYRGRASRNQRSAFYGGAPISVSTALGRRGALVGTGLWHRNAFLAPAFKSWT